MYAACYVSNRRVYVLSRIYSSHIPNMIIIHDARRPCGPLTSVPVACYINIMILIIGAHNVTPDLWSVLHNARLLYTTYVQHAHNQQPPEITEGEPKWEVEKIIKERTFGRWKKKQYLIR